MSCGFRRIRRMYLFWWRRADFGRICTVTACRHLISSAVVSEPSAAFLSNSTKLSSVNNRRVIANCVGPVVNPCPINTFLRLFSNLNHSSVVPVAKYGTASSYTGLFLSFGLERSFIAKYSSLLSFTFSFVTSKGIGGARNPELDLSSLRGILPIFIFNFCTKILEC